MHSNDLTAIDLMYSHDDGELLETVLFETTEIESNM